MRRRKVVTSWISMIARGGGVVAAAETARVAAARVGEEPPGAGAAAPVAPAAPGAPATAGVAVPAIAAAVAREARAVAAGREPAVLEHGDVVLAPYGQQVPVVRCAPLRV